MTTSFLEVISETTVSTIGIGRTLADCQQVASLFDSTCDSLDTPVNLDSHVGAEMQCTGQMMCPGGTESQLFTTDDPCVYTRKLCVTCQVNADDGETYIRLQSNQLPNHCFQAINDNPYTTGISDFSVKFNRDVTGMLNVTEDDVNSQTKSEELLCDIQRTADANMMDGTGYTEYSSNGSESNPEPPGPPSQLTTASGIAISGANIFNALASGNEDAVENEWVTLDQCLTHPTPFGEYHYHQWSPCAHKGNGWASTTVAPSMCKDLEDCRSDPIGFAVNKGWTDTSAYGYGDIIGISKDGHMIYGPYNADGDFWGCDEHDICNGAFVDGNYVYVSTKQFPYILGCFGPGPQQAYTVSCTTSSCPTDDSSAVVFGLFTNAITALATASIMALF